MDVIIHENHIHYFVYPGTNYSFKQTAQDLLEAVRCEVDRKKKLAEFTAALL